MSSLALGIIVWFAAAGLSLSAIGIGLYRTRGSDFYINKKGKNDE